MDPDQVEERDNSKHDSEPLSPFNERKVSPCPPRRCQEIENKPYSTYRSQHSGKDHEPSTLLLHRCIQLLLYSYETIVSFCLSTIIPSDNSQTDPKKNECNPKEETHLHCHQLLRCQDHTRKRSGQFLDASNFHKSSQVRFQQIGLEFQLYALSRLHNLYFHVFHGLTDFVSEIFRICLDYRKGVVMHRDYNLRIH